MDAVRQLILDRAAELKRPLSEVSKKINKNHAYLQQFIRRGIPLELPEKVRSALAREIGVPEERLRGPESKSTLKVSNGGTKQPQSRVVNNVGKVTNADPPHISTPIIPGSQLIGERDLPVFATSQGGKGAIVLSSDPVDWVARPEPLARVKDGYGVMVTGDSMFPALEPGDIVHVHPHRPPRDGSTCIFQAHRADGTVLSSIKYLRRQTADTWYVKEWNSDGKLTPREFTMRKSEWQICHVMVGKYSRS
ncbi:MAG TPA: S24 family peptidase [Verrucomicrobiae bacterium]|nr:S24 family peptidase [Verrucomicrobiae bacterium]